MIVAQVVINIGLGLISADADVLGQGELGNAIDNAEVDSLGMAALEGRDGFNGHAEDLAGRGGVNVVAAAESLLHSPVVCNVAQDPQFDLAVVRVHKDAAGLGDKHFPDLCAQVCSHRDIL